MHKMFAILNGIIRLASGFWQLLGKALCWAHDTHPEASADDVTTCWCGISDTYFWVVPKKASNSKHLVQGGQVSCSAKSPACNSEPPCGAPACCITLALPSESTSMGLAQTCRNALFGNLCYRQHGWVPKMTQLVLCFHRGFDLVFFEHQPFLVLHSKLLLKQKMCLCTMWRKVNPTRCVWSSFLNPHT